MKKYRCSVFGYIYYINAESKGEAKKEACIRCNLESSASLYFPAFESDVEILEIE